VSYLLYCIFRGPLPTAFEMPEGEAGRCVFTADYNGLSTALSEFAAPDLPPDTTKILSYERVVESFYQHLTVIPIRYGCKVDFPWEAADLLRKSHDAYGALLQDLEGLGEMGIHVLFDAAETGTESGTSTVLANSLAPDWNTGTAYLAAKRQGYLGRDRAGLWQRQLAGELCDSLRGFFVRHKVAWSSDRSHRLLSLYFLVPRDAIESFRQAARHLDAKESVKLLLSGPWPPYNFVDSLQE